MFSFLFSKKFFLEIEEEGLLEDQQETRIGIKVKNLCRPCSRLLLEEENGELPAEPRRLLLDIVSRLQIS
jgi:hypothetical protein